jgi:hypothetical protein
MMSGIASLLGIGSSQAEITDDEASDVSFSGDEVLTPAPATIKQERKGKEKEKENPKATIVEEQEEGLRVESENEEDDDDDEVGPDECVIHNLTCQCLLTKLSTDTSLNPLEAILLTRRQVPSILIS